MIQKTGEFDELVTLVGSTVVDMLVLRESVITDIEFLSPAGQYEKDAHEKYVNWSRYLRSTVYRDWTN